MKKTHFLSLLLLAMICKVNAQNKPVIVRCETMEHLELLKQNDPQIEENMVLLEKQVEDWIRSNPEECKAAVSVLRIPVVVHVLWNASDSSGNIGEEQIRSQLDVLNQDFRRKNADKSKTPGDFLPMAADCQIEFTLATQDPDSNPTSGIIRKQTLVQNFVQKKNDIKIDIRGGSDAWPKSKYLNIWVGTIDPGLLGYAQFPGGGPDSTDGVVVSVKSFGSSVNLEPPFDKGRTATHEVGHWLNLRHIWGDDQGACTADDQVNDTPVQAGPSSACPAFPQTDACSPVSPGTMFMNFMDYSFDTCMNLYTAGQKSRMRSTLNNGVRLPILSSHGILAPVDSNPNIQWQYSHGGSSVERANAIKRTKDGGYIMTGYTWSGNGDVSGLHGSNDFWVVKLSPEGQIQWQKCLGGSGNDVASSIIQTFDGGYMVAGNTLSGNGDVSGHHGSFDAWIVKLSSSGSIEWQKCLGGSLQDYAQCIIQTSDSGYAMSGYSNSNDFDVSGNHGNMDFWVVRLNATGGILWQKSLGGSNNDIGQSIVQSSNGTFVIVGYTNSNNGQVTGYKGGANDCWIVKLSATGSMLWKKCFGGSLMDNAYSVKQTTDGGYIVAGNTNSIDGNVSGTNGFQDFWVFKITPSGVLEWQLPLGGSANEYAYDVIQVTDGGYLVCGYTNSNNMDVSGNHGGYDYWTAKISNGGVLLWQKCFGGTGNDYAYSCSQGTDGGYILTGYSLSNDGDVTGNHGLDDFWSVKFTDCKASVKATPSQVFCPGITPSITLTANEQATSYLWNTGATTKSIVVSSAGTYHVTVTAGTCSSVSTPLPVSMLDCNGSVLLYDTGATSNTIYLEWYNSSCGNMGYQLQYRYSSGGNWSSSISIPFDPDGIYNYALTGLFSNTGYDVKVRSKCATSVFSPWRLYSTGTSVFRPGYVTTESKMTLWPNPSKEFIHINVHQNPGELQLSVYSILGKKLIEKQMFSTDGFFSDEVDIQSLIDGMYLLEIRSAGQYQVTRFIKAK